MTNTRGLVPLVLTCALALPIGAGAVTLHVANTGVDGDVCGPVLPCRSITQALANAAPGDTVQVGPGVYSSDVDADGVAGELGEEAAIVFVGKPVRIVSGFGASSTLIRNTQFWVTSDDVVLGKPGNGFTMITARIAVIVDGSLTGNVQRLDVRVGGNVIDLEGEVFSGIFMANTRGRVEGNRVSGHGECFNGFLLSNSWDLVSRNVAMGCDVGFHQDAGATEARVTRNTAVGNRIGFDVGTSAQFGGNAAIGNGTGVRLTPNARVTSFRGNAFVASTTNCGVTDDDSLVTDVSGNYWGAATGPGSDPADTVCGEPGVVTAPFLTSDPSRPQSAVR